MKDLKASVPTILVVEDEPVICDLCRQVLTGEGFKVDIAGNGRIARNLLAGKQYALGLIDIRTPEMSEQELYQWLKENQSQVVSRIIFTTGDVMDGDTQRFVEQLPGPSYLNPSLRVT